MTKIMYDNSKNELIKNQLETTITYASKVTSYVNNMSIPDGIGRNNISDCGNAARETIDLCRNAINWVNNLNNKFNSKENEMMSRINKIEVVSISKSDSLIK